MTWLVNPMISSCVSRTSAMTFVLPVRRRTPARLGRYPICLAINCTRLRVSRPISGASFKARETVVTPRPVMNAIVFSVGRSFSRNGLAGVCGLEPGGFRFSFIHILSDCEERYDHENDRNRFIYQ